MIILLLNLDDWPIHALAVSEFMTKYIKAEDYFSLPNQMPVQL